MVDVQLSSYSLSKIRSQRKEAEDKQIDEGTTISVSFGSPKGFSPHRYTIPEEVLNVERYEEIEDKTMEKAEERLKKGWMKKQENMGNNPTEQDWQNVWNEIQNTISLDLPEEVMEFLDYKEALPYLRVAENVTQSVYGRVDRGRSLSIQSRINSTTEELGDLTEDQEDNPDDVNLDDIDIEPGNTEYYSNMKKVSENLDFEENIEGGDVLLEDRQRTTGDLSWYNREGDERFYLITNTGVLMQTERGGQTLREFNDKTEAWNYYKQNRLG